MTGFTWSIRSLEEMSDIHPDLRKLCDKALRLSKHDFIIIDGRRTLAEQRKHFNNGASKTMKSRHLHGFAVDFVPLIGGKIRWEPVYFKPIGLAFDKASKQLRIPIVWGGNWRWKDWGHIELDKKKYPDPKGSVKD